MSETRNWKALAVPSIDGKKTQLNVSGEVQSGINPPRLTKRQSKEKRPANVIALDLSNISGGEFTRVQYQEDITGSKYDIVLVYNDKNEIEAAILIEKVQSL
jgi:hypothetical protein